MDHKTLSFIAEAVAWNGLDPYTAYDALVAYVDTYAQSKDTSAATAAAHKVLDEQRNR